MKTKTLIDFLNELIAADKTDGERISFHMPGHKGRGGIYEAAGYSDFARGMIRCDITEIPGADALFCPRSVIRSVMENYAEQYGALHTELLVNGSSAGVMAAVMAAVPIGGTLILGRNSHHSAFSAMRLGAVNPVYIEPETDPEAGLTGGIDPAAVGRACEEHPEASAVLITSPNYYGVLSDISSIAGEVHARGRILIVDQAHGAHLRFFDNEGDAIRSAGGYIPCPRHAAESLGADIVINSTHKTLLSFTGSGVLNICSRRADVARVSSFLRMLQTTSPSYILMASLDINERIMRARGPEIVRAWREDLIYFYKRAAMIDGLRVICPCLEAVRNDTGYPMYDRAAGYDLTKINLSMPGSQLGGSGLELELRKRGIYAEMVHGDYVMLMTGAGNRRSDYEALLGALREIASERGLIGAAGIGSFAMADAQASSIGLGPGGGSPRSAGLGMGAGHYGGTGSGLGTISSYYGSGTAAHSHTLTQLPETAAIPYESELIPLYQSDGRVLYDPIIIYPPGSPVVCPGEIMSLEAITLISHAIERGEKVTGVDEEGMISVGKDL